MHSFGDAERCGVCKNFPLASVYQVLMKNDLRPGQASEAERFCQAMQGLLGRDDGKAG